MRKYHIIMSALLFTWSLIIIGCGDDECATCPETKQKAVMFGGAEINSGMLEFHGNIFGIDGLIPEIDSVKVDGHMADLEEGFGQGPGASWVEYAGPAGTLDSGDDIVITIYTPTGTSSCTITLLEDEIDDPIPYGWAMSWPYDTVAIGSEIEIAWRSVPNADYYILYYNYSYNDGVNHVSEYHDPVFLTDTVFTVPSSATAYNGYYTFDINAITGPGPDATSGNITGGVVKGVINSSTYVYFTIYVGDGNAWPAAPTTPETPSRDRLRIFELMKLLYFDK